MFFITVKSHIIFSLFRFGGLIFYQYWCIIKCYKLEMDENIGSWEVLGQC